MAASQRKRRAKGEGSEWYDEKTNRWFRRETYKGQRITVADADRQGAKAKLLAKRKDIDADLDGEGGKQTLQVYLDWWLKTQAPNLKARTLHDYRQRIEYTILPSIGDIRLESLKPKKIHDWAYAMYYAYAHNSAKQSLALLRRALQMAEDLRYIERNPADKTTLPHKPRADQASFNVLDDHGTPLTGDQLLALFDAAKERSRRVKQIDERRWVDAGALFELTAKIGIRRGEAVGIRLSDLDFATGLLTIRQQLQEIGGKLIVSTPKTETGKRAIPLDDAMLATLRAHIARRAERQLKAGPRWGGSDLLFVTPLGKPILPNNLVKHFKDCLIAAELPSIRFHDLRVTAISRMRDAGIDAEVIAAIAGHSDVNVTLDIYTRVGHKRMREALETVRKIG